MKKLDDNKETQNLKEVIVFAEKEIDKNKKIYLKTINSMHKILLNSVRGNEKLPV